MILRKLEVITIEKQVAKLLDCGVVFFCDIFLRRRNYLDVVVFLVPKRMLFRKLWIVTGWRGKEHDIFSSSWVHVRNFER
jgi:hypothetical protein